MPINTVLPFISAAAPANLIDDDPDDSSRDGEAAQKLDDQTFALLKSLQLQGASGLALELISPQLDGISDLNARLKFASILSNYGAFPRNMTEGSMKVVITGEWGAVRQAGE